MVGIRSPDGLVVGSCTSHPGVWGLIPKREEPGKTGAPCVKVPGSSGVPQASARRLSNHMSSNIPPLPTQTAIARTLQATSLAVDLLYLCDSEATLNKVSRWIGSGPRTTLDGDANADIMTSIIECVRERVLKGARTFLVKVKAHRGEPLNERADTQAENIRKLPSECRQWTTRTQRLTY